MKAFEGVARTKVRHRLQWPSLTILRCANLIQKIDCINPLITIL